MPDVVQRGPFVDLLRQMGPHGAHERHEVSGEVPVSVCLFHGVHGASVAWAEFTPRIGPFVVGKPVLVVQVAVACWPQCGYKLEWRDGGYL